MALSSNVIMGVRLCTEQAPAPGISRQTKPSCIRQCTVAPAPYDGPFLRSPDIGRLSNKKDLPRESSKKCYTSRLNTGICCIDQFFGCCSREGQIVGTLRGNMYYIYMYI